MLPGPKVKGEVIRYKFLSDSRQYTLITLFSIFCASLLFEEHNYFTLSLRLACGCVYKGCILRYFLISLAFFFQNYLKQTRHPAHKIHLFDTVLFGFHSCFTAHIVLDANLWCSAITMAHCDPFLSNRLHSHWRSAWAIIKSRLWAFLVSYHANFLYIHFFFTVTPLINPQPIFRTHVQSSCLKRCLVLRNTTSWYSMLSEC